MITASESAGDAQIVSVHIFESEAGQAWDGYGVVSEDGGLSWHTYSSIEEARRDDLYIGRAKIIRLRIVNYGVEEERQPTSAELFMRELRAEKG